MLRIFALVVSCALPLVLNAPAAAQSGTSVTPDRRAFLVNKDIGAERWTINATLASAADVESIISITGTVFRSDGGPPSFVLCQVREDSTGSLKDPASTFRLTCQGTNACESSARACARDDWRPISEVVEIPAGFFLPTGGLGQAAGAAPKDGLRYVTPGLEADPDRAQKPLAGSSPGSPEDAEEAGRGATLSLDRLTYLVSKDVAGQRWSIGLSLTLSLTTTGGVRTDIGSVTGNVYFPDGREPSFVYCTKREDSTGSLEDATSEFRFRCAGAGVCTTSIAECASTAWTPIADDVRLPAGFFLPPGGLPPSVQSDPEILVIGRTSDPPSIVTKDFSLATSSTGARPQGATTCPSGSACVSTRIGACPNVAGVVADVPEFGCGCRIDDVPSACITCGAGATGSCGRTGEYPVGDAVARGVCLPASAQSNECVVYAVGAGGREDAVVEGCSGPLAGSCPSGRCCTDDPRDGCVRERGGTKCPGICVDATECGPATSCGTCEGTPLPTPTPSGSCVDLSGTWVGTVRTIGTSTVTDNSGTRTLDVDNTVVGTPLVLTQRGCTLSLTLPSGEPSGGVVTGRQVVFDPYSREFETESCRGSQLTQSPTGELTAEGRLVTVAKVDIETECSFSAGGQTFSTRTVSDWQAISDLVRE